jgi:uncharacterized membrane protein
VLANGVLVGFVLQRTADGPDWRPPHGAGEHGGRGGPDFDLRGFMFALPEEARAEARERMRADWEEIRTLFRESRRAREDVEALMRAEDFDREAVAAALQRMRETRQRMETHMEGVLLDIVGDLDAQTRAAALEAGRQRHFRRHRRDHDAPHRRPPPDEEG